MADEITPAPASPDKSFPSTDMKGAQIEMTFFDKATFHKVSLGDVKFHNVHGPGLRFIDANLSGTEFDDVNFEGVNIHNANMRGAALDDVNLSGATITNAQLRGMTINGIPVDEALELYVKSQGK